MELNLENLLGYKHDLVSNLSKEALLEAVKNYQAILDQVEDSVGQVDLKGNIIFTNKAGMKIWGNNVIGVNFRSYMDKPTADFVYGAYNRIFRTGVPDKNLL